MDRRTQCGTLVRHEEKIDRALEFFEETSASNILTLFQKISDKTKVKIILSLIKEKEMCVCDISAVLDMTIAATSHHLRLLYKDGILDRIQKGKMVYYFIVDSQVREFFDKNLA